jgi:ABC-type transport system involved in multi-copper enzyme maturation permease subunit
MTAQLRSELLKQRTTRTNLVLLLWMVGLVVLVVLLHVLSFGVDDLSRHDNQLKIAGLGTSIGALFASLLGAMSITGEIRHGTIRPTFLATPRRTRVIAAKVVASALAGIAVGLLAEALTAAVEAAGLGARGIHIQLDSGEYAQLLAGGAVAAALFAAVGVGVGALVRNQVAAVVGLCVWLLFIEPILLGDIPSAGKFAPGASAGAIAGAIQTQIADTLVAPALGVLLLAAYAAIASAGGAIATARRDIG